MHSGRWHFYRQFRTLIPLPDNFWGDADVEQDTITYIIYRIDSHPSLFRLIQHSLGYGKPVKEWHKVLCNQDTTRILIDYTRTDLYQPGLQYSEFIRPIKGFTMVMISDPEGEWNTSLDVTITHVAFEDSKAAVQWKLMQ